MCGYASVLPNENCAQCLHVLSLRDAGREFFSGNNESITSHIASHSPFVVCIKPQHSTTCDLYFVGMLSKLFPVDNLNLNTTPGESSIH